MFAMHGWPSRYVTAGHATTTSEWVYGIMRRSERLGTIIAPPFMPSDANAICVMGGLRYEQTQKCVFVLSKGTVDTYICSEHKICRGKRRPAKG